MDENEYWEQRASTEQHQYSIMIQDVNAELTRPSVLYKPRIFLDGDVWCALYGENLQDGVAGFGSSPEKAMREFDREWNKEQQKQSSRDLNRDINFQVRKAMGQDPKGGHFLCPFCGEPNGLNEPGNCEICAHCGPSGM